MPLGGLYVFIALMIVLLRIFIVVSIILVSSLFL
jgi:hypothetical protein